MHEMLPKASVEQNQGQGAFRHLFGDDSGEENLPIPSPQFKKIWFTLYQIKNKKTQIES